ncbi:MAG: DEAD/DEAH box helicase [Phycisphaerales bacterium]|nr:MAG: DEAD/DEAH box helicase [Phycisphaerales bacterium]
MHKHVKLPAEFAELGVEPHITKALARMGFEAPTDIQRRMIPLLMQGRDVAGQARTGTGKTAAFGVPTLQRLDPAGRLQAICLVPTRELASQVAGEIRRIAEFCDLNCVPVYGGQRISHQLHLLGKRPHFVVGTPGRVLDLMRRRKLPLDGIRVAILDEVDRMLDIGFRDDIRAILGQIRHPHQTVFVSATVDDEIKRLIRRFTTDPVEVNVSFDKLTVEETDQFYCTVESPDKFRLLMLLLKQEDPTLAIIFCNTKHMARKLAKKLYQAGIEAREIHGDLVQARREKVMQRFRKHHIKLLVATDLAARGIDVSAISHIINYDIPQDSESYVHRIGRTSRMGAQGKAFTFVTYEEGKELTEVEKLINKEIQQYTVDGFTPTVPPRKKQTEPPPEEAPPVASRYSQPLHSPAAGIEAPVAAPTRTLGGKFRPARRRRR